MITMQNTTPQPHGQAINWRALGILILIFFTLAMLSSCQKYPDGPMLSLRSRTARVAGTWQVKTFTVNGADILNVNTFYNDPVACGGYVPVQQISTTGSFTWSFTKAGSTSYSRTYYLQQPDDAATYSACSPVYLPDENVTDADAGTWQFIDKKSQLQITLAAGGTQMYDIDELRNNEMKLSGSINGAQYAITLTKK